MKIILEKVKMNNKNTLNLYWEEIQRRLQEE
jgi:hypothetical protein